MRILALGFCCIVVVAGACGGTIAPGATDAGSGSSSDASASTSSGSSTSSGDIGSSSGPVTGSSSGPAGSSSSASSTSSGGPVDAMTTGCANAPPPMETAQCNQCITGSCGDAWCACASDSLDDAGHAVGIGCLGYVDCVLSCTANASVQTCAMHCAPGNSQQVVSEGEAFISCMVANCLTASTCPNYG